MGDGNQLTDDLLTEETLLVVHKVTGDARSEEDIASGRKEVIFFVQLSSSLGASDDIIILQSQMRTYGWISR